MAENPVPSRVDARVLRIPSGLLIVPRDAFKHVGATFTLLNNTDFTVHVAFSAGLQMDPPEWDIPPRTAKEFGILSAEPGIYDYYVDVALSDERRRTFTLRARAESDPRIIIDF